MNIFIKFKPNGRIRSVFGFRQFSKKLLFLNIVLYITKRLVDWNGRCETPAGSVGQVRPRRHINAEEAQRPPRGKRATWSGNQPLPTNFYLRQCL